ncbi:WxcM-like domain-containing protein [Pseudoduganella sp. LjRoot289]|uniref:WxcM-like domain-containing protein n=1 Tax=Pseudoduganella sp. LjRoot289 TaxID=3342314 RepID=UPI003ECDCC76
MQRSPSSSPSAVVHDGAQVDAGAVLGDYVVVYAGAELAAGSAVAGFTQVWSGVRLEAGARLAAGVTLEQPDDASGHTVFGSQSKVGAGATICAGVKVGLGAVVEAGTVVNHDVPPYAIVSGSPARITGYVEHLAQAERAHWHRQADFPAVQATVPLGVGGVTLHRFKAVKDPRGDLSVGEFVREIPFEPKRYFLVYNVPTEKTRGEHAHHKCHQFLICVKGSCAVVVDDNESRCEVLLESPDQGIYLPPLTWGIQYKYSHDAVLLVFTSDYYEAADYIRDYDQFSAVVGAKPKQGA